MKSKFDNKEDSEFKNLLYSLLLFYYILKLINYTTIFVALSN